MSYDIQRIRELEIYLKRDEIVQWQPCFKGLSEGWYYRRAESEVLVKQRIEQLISYMSC